ncbi:MAG: glycosyltransferase [Methanolobus sp.]|nr:glycosyltransferase [Methanolobus sp.]
MRIAIFHDYFGAIGGGEKLVLMLAERLKADVISTDLDRVSVEKMGFDPANLISLGSTLKTPPLKQINASVLFAKCDFSREYDFFIFSGNWAYFAAEKHKPNLYYCHTPTRAFYDLYDVFLERRSALTSIPFMLWVKSHKKVSEHYLSHVGRIATNSENTHERIRKYFGREAEVIHPPADISRFDCREYGNFWLSVNRLYPEKRVEMQIKAFRKMPEENLVIVGGYSKGDHAEAYATNIIKDLPANVTLAGEVSEEELLDLYAACRGLICTAIEEDFGMTPVEAMASGKAVVAVDEGGFRETVVDGETGILVDASAEGVVAGVKFISGKPDAYREACIARAGMFDIDLFEEKIRNVIDNGF